MTGESSLDGTSPGAGSPGAGSPGAGSPGAGSPGAADVGRWRLLVAFVVRAIVCTFSHGFWRVRIEGRENLPSKGPFILAPVHRSNIDTPLMACITRRRVRFMGKDSLWKYPWSAWFFTTMGGFPVNRDGVDRDALRRCEAALRQGFPVVIFPEGTRRSGPKVGELFDGAAFVAVRTGAPIVPVGIGGSSRAMPVGAKALHPVKIRIMIGTPVHPPPRADGGLRGSRRHVRELTAQLQNELQHLFDQTGH